jgi:HEPN domain-containing protein
MKKKKEQAKRNLDLAVKLFEEGIYLDWVVTTSFYSSVHSVECFCLPQELRGTSCSDISDVSRVYSSGSRHQARERMAFEVMPLEIATKYKWLDDQSRNSRYQSYKVTKGVAEKAIQYAKQIFELAFNSKKT